MQVYLAQSCCSLYDRIQTDTCLYKGALSRQQGVVSVKNSPLFVVTFQNPQKQHEVDVSSKARVMHCPRVFPISVHKPE